MIARVARVARAHDTRTEFIKERNRAMRTRTVWRLAACVAMSVCGAGFARGEQGASSRGESAGTRSASAGLERSIEVRLYDVGDLAGVARLDRLAGVLNMRLEEVSQQIVALSGDSEQHQAFQGALQTIRDAAGGGRVSVEIETRRGSGAPPPAGSKASGDWSKSQPLHALRTVAAVGRPSNVSSVERVTYVRSLVPVVGSQSASYQPDVQEAQSGIDGMVLVTSVREGRAAVRFSGKMTRVILTDFPMLPTPKSTVVEWATAPVPLQQLRQRTRQIDAEIDVGAEPVVAAVVDDLEGEGWLAVTVRVVSAP